MSKQGWIETFPAAPASLPCARGPFDKEEEEKVVWVDREKNKNKKKKKISQREIAEQEG